MFFASPMAYINPDESADSEEDEEVLDFRTSYNTSRVRASSRVPGAPVRPSRQQQQQVIPNISTPNDVPSSNPNRVKSKKKKTKKHTQVGADTNVVELKFSSLADKADIFTGND